MQIWSGQEGEALTLGDTPIDCAIVAVYGRDGFIEVIIPEADRGETVADAKIAAEKRRQRRAAAQRLTRRRNPE